MRLDRQQVDLVSQAIASYQHEFSEPFYRLLNHAVGVGVVPGGVQKHMNDLDRLGAAVENIRGSGGEVDDSYAPLLRRVVSATRLQMARDVECRRALTIDAELLAELDGRLRPYAVLMASGWFREAAPCPVPSLSESFAISLIESRLAENRPPPREREHDEKFRILQAPSLFLDDLDRARQAAALRGICLAVAYIDIDKFKDFKSEYGEPNVDRRVLPKFMRHLEAHVYMRGHAYRYGGDEYVVLLNNVTEGEARESMDRLREGLGALTYDGTRRSTTVSIGVVVVRPDLPPHGP
jgi:diguanylate cyclase (GGDEF)-like protein